MQSSHSAIDPKDVEEQNEEDRHSKLDFAALDRIKHGGTLVFGSFTKSNTRETVAGLVACQARQATTRPGEAALIQTRRDQYFFWLRHSAFSEYRLRRLPTLPFALAELRIPQHDPGRRSIPRFTLSHHAIPKASCRGPRRGPRRCPGSTPRPDSQHVAICEPLPVDLHIWQGSKDR